jgi:2,4-dienoyl-CoA reductase-like NADH-dependent reductase (Old Yellow Enzyme family)
MAYRRIAGLKSTHDFGAHVASLGQSLPIDETIETGPDAPLAQPLEAGDVKIGNRFAILPMEGWDGTTDGRPSELTFRRWRRFGQSGAKLIWGGEAVSVRPDARANPNELYITAENVAAIAELRNALVEAHGEKFGRTDDLFVGLQLTHSGRFCRPNDKTKPEPQTLYRHPILDGRVGIQDESTILSDDKLRRLIDDFVSAAGYARQAGFAFVDVKH